MVITMAMTVTTTMAAAASIPPLLSDVSMPTVLLALLLGSLAALIPGGRRQRAAGIFSTALLAVLFAATTPMLLQTGVGRIFPLFAAQFLGSASLFADGMSSILVPVTLLLAAVVSLYATRDRCGADCGGGQGGDPRRGFFTLLLLYIAGMVGLFESSNLILFFVFFELMLVSSWLLIGFWGGRSLASGMKYFMYTEFGALLLLLGILAYGGATGSMDLLAMQQAPELTSAVAVAVALMTTGILVKSAAFPLHSWLPDTYCSAPTAASALLSYSTVAVGGYALLRVFQSFAPAILEDGNLMLALSLVGLVNIVYGGIIAMRQSDMKRLLAYSSISQVGYMLIGVASSAYLGFLGVVIWAVAHGLGKSALFMIAGIFRRYAGSDDLSRLSGLAGRMPITSSMLLASFLSLAGIPPLLGFWGEIFIFLGYAYSAVGGAPDYARLAVVAAGVVATVISAGYALLAVRRALYGAPNDLAQNSKDPPASLWVPVVLSVLALCVLGIFPSIVTGAFWIYVP